MSEYNFVLKKMFNNFLLNEPPTQYAVESPHDKLIKYILSSILGEEKTDNLLKEFEAGGEMVMTAMDCIVKEIEEEKIKSRKEGIKSIAIKMLEEGMDINKISKLTGFTIKEITSFKI